MRFYGWLVKKFGMAIAWLIIVLVTFGLLFGGYSMVKRFFTSGLKTEIKLGKEKGKAAVESGSDAVDTVNNRATSDQEALRQAEETKDEINRQTDAGGVTDAGRSGLCQRSPNRRGCGGVQRAPSR